MPPSRASRKSAPTCGPPSWTTSDCSPQSSGNWASSAGGIRCKIETKSREPVVPQDVATGIFRIFQETLTNIARHAEAANVRVRFQANEKDILLTVSDDGKGIDPKRSAVSKSLGILGMAERAQALGGTLVVHPAKPRGTRVELSIPLERRTSRRATASSIP